MLDGTASGATINDRDDAHVCGGHGTWWDGRIWHGDLRGEAGFPRSVMRRRSIDRPRRRRGWGFSIRFLRPISEVSLECDGWVTERRTETLVGGAMDIPKSMMLHRQIINEYRTARYDHE
jgi:hypothetical protein